MSVYESSGLIMLPLCGALPENICVETIDPLLEGYSARTDSTELFGNVMFMRLEEEDTEADLL